MSVVIFLLAGATFIGGLVWVIISSASGKRVGPGIAVMLSSLLLFFLGVATCAGDLINIFS